MKRLAICLGMAMALAAPLASHALEPFVLYDNFTNGPLDPDRWGYLTNYSRAVQAKQLRLTGTAFGATDSNTSFTGSTFSSPLVAAAPGAPLQEIRANITVNSISATGCAANTTATQARARLWGSFFNVGTPVAGNFTGDVIAQISLRRLSNAVDAPNVVHAVGAVDQCLDSGCNATSSIGSIDLGTAVTGQSVKLQLQWDKANNRFLYKKDADAAQPLAYTVSDAAPPGNPAKHVAARFLIANCTTAPRPTGAIDASFDNIYVNQSAFTP